MPTDPNANASNHAASRREFLSAAALAAVGGAAASASLSACASSSSTQATTSNTAPSQPAALNPNFTPSAVRPTVTNTPRTGPLRIGLVGCGGRGTGAAVQALKADPDTIIVAAGDVFQDRLDSCIAAVIEEMGDQASRVQVPPERRFTGFDSYKPVIDSDVDVVLLCGYPSFRPMHLAYAVERGKHTFAEKPVAVDGPGLRSVLASAKISRDKGLACLVGFCWRYHDGMRAAFDRVNSGELGQITSVYTNYLGGTLGKKPRKESWSDMEFQMRNWWHFTWISGDHIVEQAVHSIDRLRWATGDRLPTRVTCLGGRAARSGPEHGNVFDNFSAIYEYEGGMKTFHACRQIDGLPNDNSDYIEGTLGSAVIGNWGGTLVTRDRAGNETWKYAGPKPRDMYQAEHDELFRSIRAGKPINDCEEGAHSTLMAIMARMAAYTGQTITWEQALNSKEDLMPASLAMGPIDTPPIAVPGRTKFI
jgi:myo-inositol 2-dehydrogenase / D-chiro-inositol 1-dehydrogenase